MFRRYTSAAFLGTFWLCAAAGCKSGSKGSSVKDLEVSGANSFGSSGVDLRFYPVKGENDDVLIQSARCVLGTCTYRCAPQSAVVEALNENGRNGEATVAKIYDPEKSETDDEGLSADLERAIVDRCDAKNPYRGLTSEGNQGDSAQSYTLLSDGTFYRTVWGKRCDIGANVEDFKVSRHPGDGTGAYFIKGGNLWFIGKSTDKRGRVYCPARSLEIVPNIAKVGSTYQYFVTSKITTKIISAALGANGDFIAWNNKSIEFEAKDVSNVEMNSCFDTGAVQGLNSFVALLQKRDGSLVKVGVDPTPANFANLDEFRTKLKSCK